MYFEITGKSNMQVFICNSYVQYELMAPLLAMIPFVCHFVPLFVVSEGMPHFLCQLSCLSVYLF